MDGLIKFLLEKCDPYNYFRTTDDNRILAGGEVLTFIQIYKMKISKRKYFNTS